jgi:hypothetical protein
MNWLMLNFAVAATLSIGSISKKSEDLVLHKKRHEAYTVIRKAIEQTKNLQRKNELIELQIRLGQIFLNEKTQQAYELAMSLVGKDNPGALSKLNDAKVIEGDNILVLMTMAKLYLIQGQNESALKEAQNLLRLGVDNEEVRLIQSAALLGQNQLEDFEKTRHLFNGLPDDMKATRLRQRQKSAAQSNFAAEWALMDLEKSFRSKDVVGIANGMVSLSRANPNHLELHYWKFKTDSVQTESGRKYIEGCKKLFATGQREYKLNPFLCQRVAEVESGATTNGITKQNSKAETTSESQPGVDNTSKPRLAPKKSPNNKVESQ